MNIIIIDDHPLVRKGLVSVLSLETDFNIVGEASCVKDALKLINDKRPDLALIDIRLGKENGLDVIEQCKIRNMSCKFLVLTSSADEGNFIRAKELGSYGYILKEAFTEELLYAVQLVGKGKKYYDPSIIDEIINKSEHDNILEELTEREQEVLIALGEGLNNKDIANKLYISIYTVKKHVSQILAKLNMTDRTQAALYIQSIYLQKIN